MKPLTAVAAQLSVDYHRFRLAAIRGEFRAELKEGKWYADVESAQRWVDRRSQERVTVA